MDPNTGMDYVGLISQVGFPIACAGYCLIKLNKTIAENTKMLNAVYQKLMGGVSLDGDTK